MGEDVQLVEPLTAEIQALKEEFERLKLSNNLFNYFLPQ